jgi:hypothetical protein
LNSWVVWPRLSHPDPIFGAVVSQALMIVVRRVAFIPFDQFSRSFHGRPAQ